MIDTSGPVQERPAKPEADSKKRKSFEGCNEARTLKRAAVREERKKQGLPVREPKPKKTQASIAVGPDEPLTKKVDVAVGDSKTYVDASVGESLWGDPFQWRGIWDMP